MAQWHLPAGITETAPWRWEVRGYSTRGAGGRKGGTREQELILNAQSIWLDADQDKTLVPPQNFLRSAVPDHGRGERRKQEAEIIHMATFVWVTVTQQFFDIYGLAICTPC